MALIVDGEEAGNVRVSFDSQSKSHVFDSRLPAAGSALSSIHGSSSSDVVMSEDSSVLESMSGHTRDTILATDNNAGTARRTVQSPELWKLPDDRFDICDPACNLVDFENDQLNETLKSLMETKTPMLPSRVRTAVKPQQQRFSRPSAIFVEPRTISTHRSIPASVHSDVSNHITRHGLSHHSDADVADFRSSMVTEFANVSYQDTSHQSPVQSKHRRSVNIPKFVEAVDRDGRNAVDKKASPSGVQSLPPGPSNDIQCSIDAAAAESELVEWSLPATDVVTSPVLTVPRTDSLDSLIARYQNLRVRSDVDSRVAKPTAEQVFVSKARLEPASYAEHLLPSHKAVSIPAASIVSASKTVNPSNQVASVAAVRQQSSGSVAHADGAVTDDLEVDDLCNDNFDDIRMTLQNVSVDSAHTPASIRHNGELYDLCKCPQLVCSLQLAGKYVFVSLQSRASVTRHNKL